MVVWPSLLILAVWCFLIMVKVNELSALTNEQQDYISNFKRRIEELEQDLEDWSETRDKRETLLNYDVRIEQRRQENQAIADRLEKAVKAIQSLSLRSEQYAKFCKDAKPRIERMVTSEQLDRVSRRLDQVVDNSTELRRKVASAFQV